MDDTDVLEIPLARREGEEERVLAWRESELVRAGFHPDDAFELACRPDVDLHQAIDLIARGCSPPTALRILL
jgi:hypothetical protein